MERRLPSKPSQARRLPAARAPFNARQHYLRCPTIASSPFARSKTTIQQVKSYRTERIKNGIKFACTRCTHSVTTLDFDAKAGNLRTQAAAAINHHAAQTHHDPTIVPSRDAELRTSRQGQPPYQR
ncbi:MAG: hypothetical protein WAU58_08470 [Terriglobales bacterium]